MGFFAVSLQKFVPSCEIIPYSTAISRKVLYRKWPPLALSLSQYCALFADVTFVRCKWRVRHCSGGVYSHYAIPRGTALTEIRGLSNFRVGQ